MIARADAHFRHVADGVGAFYRALRRLYEASDHYATRPLAHLWGQQNMKTLVEIIEGAPTPGEAIAAAHRTFMFSVNTDDEDLKRRMIDWYVGYLRRRGTPIEAFDPLIEESLYSNPANAVIRDGRRLAPDFLRTLILALEIEEYCALPAGHTSVLELGAGYGGLARTFKLRHPEASYVIVDIPEALYFSATFIGLNFPRARILHVTDAAELATDLTTYDFVFVPTLLADALAGRSFTVFCNTASLGEMRNSVIRYWMDFVETRVNVRYFFGLNRFLNTIDPRRHASRLGENVCSVSFDRHWKILWWEVEPPFTRCPYVETEVSRNLEIVAERVTDDAEEAAAGSRRLLEDVLRQDWIVHYDADNTMKLRDNALAPDLTKTGTLFALWESIRLDPRADNAAVMLKYLGTLTRGKSFEEMFYYRGLVDAGGRGGIDVDTPSRRRPGRASLLRRAVRRIVTRLRPGGLRRPPGRRGDGSRS
jgi:putative sugar O-methyltransferase